MDDTVCPRCGYQFNIAQAKISTLSASAREIWDTLGWRWQVGIVKLGPSEIAKRVSFHEATVRYHLSIMVAEGLVTRYPQNERVSKRHLYTGTLSREHLCEIHVTLT